MVYPIVRLTQISCTRQVMCLREDKVRRGPAISGGGESRVIPYSYNVVSLTLIGYV